VAHEFEILKVVVFWQSILKLMADVEPMNRYLKRLVLTPLFSLSLLGFSFLFLLSPLLSFPFGEEKLVAPLIATT
jgi:hypothetical protein